MSDLCGNCDCADRSQCVKKGNGYAVAGIVGTENSGVMEAWGLSGMENDGKCKCCSNCTCANCNCGH